MKKYTLFISVLCLSSILSAQSLTNIDPSAGLPLEPLTVTITGQNTNFNQATNTLIWFSQGSITTQYPSSVNIISNTQAEVSITFDANFYNPIIYDVNYYNELDGMLILPQSFTLQTLPDPIILSVSPNQSNKLETLNVTISGENTYFNQATGTVVWFSQGSETIIPNTINVSDNTTIDAQFSFPISVPTGYYDVNVLSEIEGLLHFYSGFYLNDMIYSPQVINIVPEYILTNESVTIQINGEHTHFTQANNIFIWMDSDAKDIIYASSFSILNNERIDVNFSFPENTPFQTYNLHIMSDFDGEIVFENGFRVGPSLITTITNDENLIISPNPIKDFLNIKYTDIIEIVKLYDIKGQYINKFNVFSKQASLNFNRLSKGIYFIQVYSKGKTIVKPIIIK